MIESEPEKQKEILWHATDRILYIHRNLKMFMFMTTGPFFAVLFLIKYTLKFGILYFLYNKKKKSDSSK